MKIAIIGGGTSGLFLAGLLTRAGYAPIVFEKSSELRAEGCGVMLRSMGLKVLGEASNRLQKQMVDAGMQVAKYQFRNLGGKIFQEFDTNESQDDIPNSIVIDRAAITKLLGGSPIRLGLSSRKQYQAWSIMRTMLR